MQEDAHQPRPPPRLARIREEIARRAEESRDAWTAAAEMKVVRLQEAPAETWIVMGREADYIVVTDTFCSCPHFIYRVAAGGGEKPCYHLAAVRIAKAASRFHDLTARLSRDEVEAILLETLASGRSATLRRILHKA